MKVFVLIDWGYSVVGVVSTQEEAVARGFIRQGEWDAIASSNGPGIYEEHEVDAPDSDSC